MPLTKPSLSWSLRLIAILSLVGPALIFAYATWQSHHDIDEQANERIERALDVLHEHALKALQTVERSISEINEVIRNVPDEAIRARESDFFLRLKRTQQALPQIEAIWIFDQRGHPLVSSTILPVPRDLNNSDRSYFAALRDFGVGTFVSEVIRARIGPLSFFVVSGRRTGDTPGRFEGVIAATAPPQHFTDFYRKLSRGRDSFALARADGVVLARWPQVSAPTPMVATDLTNQISAHPDNGMYISRSRVDGIERRIGYRRVPGFPVYVLAGIETGALRDEFLHNAFMRIAIGLPAALLVFTLAIYALRRTQIIRQEMAKRETAENALKQAQRLEAIGQLTGGVAHDFNNLLMIVSGNLDRLRRFLILDDRSKRCIDAIETAVQRGTKLTRQLLSFSRRQTHEAKVIDLREVLLAVREMLQSSLRGDIQVRMDIENAVWRTKIDISEFELALLNLSVNARDAMPSGGLLTISARNVVLNGPNEASLTGEFIAISVADTGSGIPREKLHRVFEPFFTTKEVGRGTGLGLSQVYGFARQAGGSATISSEIGYGTQVTLFLPRSLDSLEPHEKVADKPRPPDAPHSMRVLLVEDNSEVAEVTRAHLEALGYQVTTVGDVLSAQKTLEEATTRTDVVLTDIVMPGGANGLDLARWVRRKYGNSVAIVLATGYSDKAQIAADEGFLLLRKPYTIDQLKMVIADAMRESHF